MDFDYNTNYSYICRLFSERMSTVRFYSGHPRIEFAGTLREVLLPKPGFSGAYLVDIPVTKYKSVKLCGA